MDGLDINTLISLSPVVTILMWVIYKQEQRNDKILAKLLRLCPNKTETVDVENPD